MVEKRRINEASSKIVLLFCFLLLLVFTLQPEMAQASSRINFETKNGEVQKSKIFIIGATGKFGRLVVNASVKAKHKTVALVRLPTIQTNQEKAALVEYFKTVGVEIVYGDINIDHEVLVDTMKRVDVVISCVAGLQVPDQVNITSAILEAGNIKRFIPSEFAIDVDRLNDPVEPAKSLFAAKAQIRRVIESQGIPYTFVVANGFGGRYWPNLMQTNPISLLPNIHSVVAFGDGNMKIVTIKEEDAATYTVKTIDDPCTLNKLLYLRPKKNILSFNEMFELWIMMSGTTLEKTYIPELELLEMIKNSTIPENIFLSVCYSVPIKGDYLNYDIDPATGVDASKQYPQVKYTTVEGYFDQVLLTGTASSATK